MAAQPLARAATPIATTTAKPLATTAPKNAELKLLPPHQPAVEMLDAVERLAHAAEKAAAARFELALHTTLKKATTTAKTLLASFGITGGALLVALSAWIFLMVGSALALTPLVGGGFATLIVGGGQAVVAAVLFVVAKKTGDAVKV